MGLAVSQVRLLALTTRKADIELQMQVDTKRKQMLTRKSTELAQQYYSRLQDTNIQYATSNGYEDVTWNYLMGQSSNGQITGDFLQQVATGTDYGYAQKTDNRMILTDQYGQVVLNNEVALAVEKARDSYPAASISTKSARAIWELLESNQDVAAVSSIYTKLSAIGEDVAIKYMELMLKNGGYMNGGIVYTNGSANGGPYVDSASKLTSGTLSEADYVKLQAGYCYQVLNSSGAIVDSVSGNFYDGSAFTGLTKQIAQYLGNIISYYGPMISAAMQNNSTATSSIQANGKTVNGNERGNAYTNTSTDASVLLNQAKGILTNNGDCCVITDASGIKHYYSKSNNTVREIKAKEYYTYSVPDGGNSRFDSAQNTDKLQAGFKSGTYQLCMVSDAYKGIYHKNTTLEYFVHMNYVVEKTDSSAREEITAWFNAEQAAISEQETYWDTEITNLSTELNSVNTEIESVKTLKSNAIKSVFDWGSS